MRADIIAGGTIHVGDTVVALNTLEEQNKDLIRRYYEEMWNRWDFELAEQILAFRQYMQTVRDVFPDFHNTIEELVAENQDVVARLTYHSTHRGEIFGIAPTEKKITYAGAAFFQIAGRRITEGWVLGDRMSLLQQLGEASVSGLAGTRVKE